MPDQPKQPRNLSEISHLFLSSVRERQTQGQPRPVRVPPQSSPHHARTDLTIDLSPEEFAHVFGDEEDAGRDGPKIGPVSAVLASHLGAQQLARVQEYASHLCMTGQRIGLIAVDASEFRLSIFEQNPHPQSAGASGNETDMLDPRRMTEALDELAWDVDRWLLLLPSPRAPEARSLLRDVSQWTLLTTCDHEGVVACYRTVKGLSDLHRPRLTLATLDVASESSASDAFHRLSSVCRQFLGWRVESESPVAGSVSGVTEHVVLWCCATRDKAQLATAPQWQVVTDFLARAQKNSAPAVPSAVAAPATAKSEPAPAMEPAPSMPAAPEPNSAAAAVAHHENSSDVIDLPDSHASPAAIVAAVLRGGHELVECPVKPPMCPDASLAVSRDHRLVLVAVARQGLNDLRLIGRAYQWLIENRALINLAVPQMSIDAHQLPRLHLLVDHADMSADVLQPMLQSASVVVHAYRKLRWGNRTGLLLEAA